MTDFRSNFDTLLRWYKAILLLFFIGLLWFYRVEIFNHIAFVCFMIYLVFCGTFGIPLPQLGP